MHTLGPVVSQPDRQPDSMGPDGVEEGNDSVHTKVKQKNAAIMYSV